MPLHEYKCPRGHITTRVVSIKDKNEPKDTTACEKCGKSAERLAPVTGIPILKAGKVGGFFKPNA